MGGPSGPTLCDQIAAAEMQRRKRIHNQAWSSVGACADAVFSRCVAISLRHRDDASRRANNTS
ncbi:DUF6053 domain-containing protein [Lysobacter enzymogenes]|uniref:DUF6053 domain-containing protein n=1 Tax=Lysobacter enzymogenes TaxID=69 RepID=UPI003D2F6578